MVSNCFFRAFILNKHRYRYGSADCGIVTGVSEHVYLAVVPVGLAEHMQMLKRCALPVMISALSTYNLITVHITRAVLEGVK